MANDGRTRQDKIDWFLAEFEDFFREKPEGVISKRKILSAFAMDNNSTERTGLEILRGLEIRGIIKLQGDDIIK